MGISDPVFTREHDKEFKKSKNPIPGYGSTAVYDKAYIWEKMPRLIKRVSEVEAS